MTISSFLTSQHRECDEIFALAEESLSAKDWNKTRENFDKFSANMLAHFAREENILFPDFESATGMTGGPTQMMRVEHTQMRDLLNQMAQAVQKEDKNGFFGVAETLHIMIQQHNMKEEQILYPMCESHLGQQADQLIERLKKN